MATDMLENCGLSALDHSRLGNKNFIDEGQRAVKRQVIQGGYMFTGEEDFYNLFGSRNKKKANFRAAQRALYKDLKDDCDNIQLSIDIISNDVATLLKKKSDLETKERLSEANNVLGIVFQICNLCNTCAPQKFC